MTITYTNYLAHRSIVLKDYLFLLMMHNDDADDNEDDNKMGKKDYNKYFFK